MDVDHWLEYLLPWEFSWLWLGSCLLAVVLYGRGLRVMRRRGERLPRWWHQAAFYVGIGSIYLVAHTGYDYLSQFLFFAHRAQHIVMHHLGPMLLAFSWPLGVLGAGLPERFRQWSGWRLLGRILHPVYRVVQHPLVASVLFVGLIFFWLHPILHYYAMLSRWLYQVMNWSMTLDGLLFWWLVLDRRSPDAGGLKYRWRFASLIAVTPPQIILGAFIFLSSRELFDVYTVCGRAWTISPMVDQQIGGLLTWIPPAMMSLVGVLIVARFAMDTERQTMRVAAPSFAN